MNCFTHALPFLDDAHFVVGTCLPDWMSACDRKCRLREKAAEGFSDDHDPIVATIAQGVVQHHQDDDWFHRGAAFNELILNFAVELRELFSNERSMRPSLIGHIIVEMFLDAYLHAQNPGELERFYKQVESVDPDQVQAAINQFATRPTEKLADGIRRFAKERFIFDYETDKGVVYRINNVMRRVGLDAVPAALVDWAPQARERVYAKANDLLLEYPVEV
jgi:hypothetical protein